MSTSLDKLKGKQVEVRARGFVYRGKLVEITPEVVYLKRKTGWVSIATESISSIKEPGEAIKESNPKFVDAKFYQEDEKS